MVNRMLTRNLWSMLLLSFFLTGYCSAGQPPSPQKILESILEEPKRAVRIEPKSGDESGRLSPSCIRDETREESCMNLLALIRLFLREETTLADMIEVIGPVVERIGEDYDLAPKDQRFRQATVTASRADWDMKLPYFDLYPNPKADLTLRQLPREFGDWENMLPQYPGNVFSVVYEYDDATFPYKGFIFVRLTDRPSKPDARIKRISIRRDPRS